MSARTPARAVWLLAFALGSAQSALAQAAKPAAFDGAAFGVHEQDARWLFGYAEALRHARDAAAKIPRGSAIGPDAFCIDNDPVWDCTFGRYDAASDRYAAEILMRQQDDGPFNRVPAAKPSPKIAAYARAIATSRKAMPPALAGAGFAFAPFVRALPDKRIEVWWLPAAPTDGTMIYGGELRHRLDPEGRRIVDTQLVNDGFRAVTPMPGKQLTIDNRANGVPTVGQLFFMISFHDRFKAIMVASKTYATTVVVSQENELGWVNIPLPKDKAR